ncbi:MAG: MFS transporter [Pseudomonadota bacterium]
MSLSAGAQTETTQSNWEKSYELKAVSLLAIGFGLVGLDRFIIAPLFPAIAEDLGLNYQDLGLISGVLALTWGIASLFAGKLTDRVGHRRVVVTSVILFSSLVAMSGLATGLTSLIVIRALMGFAEGGFVPASIVATMDAAKPTRIGLVVGIQQMASPLVGLGLGPIVAVTLLQFVSWEWVFAIIAVPGFVLAYFLQKTLRPPEEPAPASQSTEAPGFRSVLAFRNVVFGALAMICFFSSLHPLSAFMPSYMTDHLGLSMQNMGFVMSAMGMGGVIGMLLVPALSDRLGRKPVLLLAMAVACAAMWLIILGKPATTVLALCLFTVSFTVSGAIAITIGPLMHASVPLHMTATATGLVAGLGEIVGGAIVPAVAGGVADASGIESIFYITGSAAILGLAITAFGIKEPAKQ